MDIVQDIQARVTSIEDITASSQDDLLALDAIKSDTEALKTNTDLLPNIDVKTSNVQIEVNNLGSSQYVPFSTAALSSPEVCVPEGAGRGVDNLVIDAESDFMITSVLFSTNGLRPGSENFNVLFLIVDDVLLFEKSAYIQTDEGEDVHAFDIMGMNKLVGAGKFPTTIAANGEGSEDVIIQIECTHSGDDGDVEIRQVVVSGWKQAEDNVSVTYQQLS